MAFMAMHNAQTPIGRLDGDAPNNRTFQGMLDRNAQGSNPSRKASCVHAIYCRHFETGLMDAHSAQTINGTEIQLFFHAIF